MKFKTKMGTIFTIRFNSYPDEKLFAAGYEVSLQWRWWKLFCLRYDKRMAQWCVDAILARAREGNKYGCKAIEKVNDRVRKTRR